MGQNPLTVSLSSQTLSHLLGISISETQLQGCLSQVQVAQPKVSAFWHSQDNKPRLYIVLAGRVRLLDDAENLVKTLGPGKAFLERDLGYSISGAIADALLSKSA